jgi:hypothetical protein
MDKEPLLQRIFSVLHGDGLPSEPAWKLKRKQNIFVLLKFSIFICFWKHGVSSQVMKIKVSQGRLINLSTTLKLTN